MIIMHVEMNSPLLFEDFLLQIAYSFFESPPVKINENVSLSKKKKKKCYKKKYIYIFYVFVFVFFVLPYVDFFVFF